jgi:hypothetical protein
MLAHPWPFVHVAALTTGLVGNLTFDWQAGCVDPDTSLAAACGSLLTAFSEEFDR